MTNRFYLLCQFQFIGGNYLLGYFGDSDVSLRIPAKEQADKLALQAGRTRRKERGILYTRA